MLQAERPRVRLMFVLRLRLPQLVPVNSTVGLVEATDVDSQPLFYRLESTTVRTSRSEVSNSGPRARFGPHGN